MRKLLEREPALAGELRALLAEVPEPRVQQIISQEGDQNRAVGVVGRGNTVNVS